MSEDLTPDTPPQIPVEIPSAVRSDSSWSTRTIFGLGAIVLVVVFTLKGTGTKPVDAQDAPTLPSTPSAQPPLPQLPTLEAMSTARPSRESEGPSLRDVRRQSPVLIYNDNASPEAAPAAAPDSSGSTVPMPSNFHPSAAARSQSSTLGDREFIIAQGKLLDAVLESGINTDQPGMIRALISDDIYSDSGRTVLLPRGSRLIGQYDADVAQGQSRVFILWQRVIRPDGIDIRLDSGGTDPLGQAGVEGSVNRHFWTMFGAATLLSVIGAASATVGVQPQDAANSAAAYRSSVAQGFNEAANNVMGVFVRIKPTITIRPGTAIKVFVARDLYFDPSQMATDHVQVIP